MRISVLLFLLWCAAGAANGQTVDVRAGEHEAFTRLVFNMPERLAYRLQRSPGKAILSLDAGGLRFDTTGVFQRVPKTRLTDIRSDDGGRTVRLSLACDCDVEAFWYGRAFLVVDVHDPEAEDSVQAEAKPRPLWEMPTDPPAPSLLQELAPARHGAAARQFSRLFSSRLAEQAPPTFAADASSAATEGIREGRDRLIRQMARAASQGLLSPRASLPEPAPPPHPTPAPTPLERGALEAGAATTPPLETPPPNVQLLAETRIDRDLRAALSTKLGATVGVTCPDPESVNVANWGSEAPFWAQIGPLRSRIVGEFDEPDPSAVKELARLYIYFGFGAEARQTLVQFGLSKRDMASLDTAVLFDLAAIMEKGHAEPGSSVSKFLGCAAMPALWAALSSEALPGDRPIDTEAILRGFSALPPHLRAELGPALARRFRDAGYVEESDQVRRILKRNDATVTSEAQLLEAEISLETGDIPAAQSQLETLVEEDVAPSAEALVKLIEAHLARDDEISYDLAQLAGAYAVERRDDPLGARLSRAYVMALAASGAFEQAFEELPNVPDDDADARTSTLSELMALVTRRADDFEFLRYALEVARRDAAALEPETANEIARRLLSLGFPDVAAQMLEPETIGPSARTRQLLRAETLLKRNRPRQAEAALVGLRGEASDLLRARARSMAGEHKTAARLFREAGREAEARQEAWLGGDWAMLSESDDEAVAVLAARRLAQGNEPQIQPADNAILAQERALIADSANLRDAITAMLASHSLPDLPAQD